MYIIALTGGIEEPSFIPFATWEDVETSLEYNNKFEFVRSEYGERFDVLKVEDGQIRLIESFTN